jgi:hypothetical protein
VRTGRPGQHALRGSAFPGDTGEADAALAAAISARSDGPEGMTQLLRALAVARVFVAVSATTGSAHAEIGLVSITGRDGRRAVPVFTSADRLTGWRPGLRPVPVEGSRAARTALDDGAAALVVDPGRSPGLVVAGSDLDRLAAVWTVAAARAGSASEAGKAGETGERSRRGDAAP